MERTRSGVPMERLEIYGGQKEQLRVWNLHNLGSTSMANGDSSNDPGDYRSETEHQDHTLLNSPRAGTLHTRSYLRFEEKRPMDHEAKKLLL